jgi:hypothetical protein
MEVTSDWSAEENPRAEQGWHTEGAWIPRDLRVEWICLLGLDDAPRVYTAYAPVKPLVQMLSMRTREWLRSQSVRFRAPLSLGLGPNAWSEPCAILSESLRGEIEIAWDSCEIRAVRPYDKLYDQALTELYAEINRQHILVSIEAGSLMAFNNVRGVHMHTPADDGDRHLYKSYARQSLRKLKRITGDAGPIFDLRKVLTSEPKARRLLADRCRSTDRSDVGGAMNRFPD